MRLKSLKLAGFKSFANPTTFTFKHDITAIVGPNGCGKSNVIDAIRWVLGETSAKQIRGAAMSDVIFAGVEGRAGKSLASVELTFEHTQDERTGIRHALNLYHELTLRRQVSLDGKSDYFINGQRVRRRDVVDVFLGTGLGARSYAVIEQGMIGRIVESSPLELRAFIEEAAGVSRYQARRIETQKQLDDTKDNLERLSDLQSELKKQQKTLINQAKSAERYKALKSQMTDIQKNLLLKRIFELWQTVNLKKDEQQAFAKDMAQLEQHLAQAKRELDQNSQHIAQETHLKDSTKDQYHNARMAQQTAEHNFYQLNQQISQTDEHIKQLTHAKQQAKDNIQKSSDELANIVLSLDEITPQMSALQDEIGVYQQKLTAHQALWQKARAGVERLGATCQQLRNQKQLALTGQQRLNTARERWQKRHDELLKDRQALAKMRIDDTELATLKSHIDELQRAIDDIRLDDDKRALDEMNAKAGALKGELATLEKRHASKMGEHDTLHRLTFPKPTLRTQSTKSSTKPTSHAHHALNALKDEISLTPLGQQYGALLDEFLGFWLDAKIGDASCVDIVSTNTTTPTAIFYPSKQPPDEKDLPTNGDFILMNSLLDKPKLALFDDVCLYVGQGVPDVPDGKVVLTKTGWIVGGFGVVQASKFGEKSNFLSQKIEHMNRLHALKSELNEMSVLIDDKKQALQQLNAQRFKLRAYLDEQTARRGALIDKKHHTKTRLIGLESDQKNHALKSDIIHKTQAQLDSEQAEHDSEARKLTNDIKQSDDELAKLSPALQIAKDEFEHLGKQTDEYQRAIKERQDKAQVLHLQKQALSQSQIHENKLLALATHALTQAEQDIKATQDKKNALNAQLPSLQALFEEAKAHTDTLKVSSDEHEAMIHSLQSAHAKLQDEHTKAHAKLQDAQAHAAQVGADLAVGESRLADLAEQMMAYDEAFHLPSVLADFRVKQPVFDDDSVRLDEIKKAIDNIGAVNLTAAAELAELDSRVLPMEKQIKDITDSMDKLKDAIRAIDDKTKTLFLNMLNAVNAELNALFGRVFGGGQASLSLIDDDGLSKADKWRAGLVLMAQPRGKKNSRLSVLSGGEKTLTALSLIFAIFKQHPAPFCVLDEVDAPLDDANVGRFTSLIGELSNSVQFIFISHNKLAMQTAHELKGITMPTAGISTLVTVNLEEAQKYVES